MRFSEFLEKLQETLKLKSSAQLFEYFGGEESLKCTKRGFDLVRSGERKPSTVFFNRLFARLPHQHRKPAVSAYFASALDDEDSTELMKFLDINMSPGIPDHHESVWDKDVKKLQLLTAQQLDYMTENPTALRLFDRVLLYDHVPNHELLSYQDEVRELNRLNLTQLKRDGLHSKFDAVKIPSAQNASRHLLEKANRYIFEHVTAYADMGGGGQQELSYAIQKVRADHVDMIIKAQQTFKKWLQDLAVRDDVKCERVPLFHVGFTRAIGEKEF